MNILPKKRWHVRTKENIARVRRDEAKAAEEKRSIEDRVKLAEREARRQLLISKSRSKHLSTDFIPFEAKATAPDTHSTPPTGHINFFQEVEEGVAELKQANKEHDKEVKAEKEKYEKQIGYLTYLGQDTNEALGKKSWYEEAPARWRDGEKGECKLKGKEREDPMFLVKKLTDQDRKAREAAKEQTRFKKYESLLSKRHSDDGRHKRGGSESSKRGDKKREKRKRKESATAIPSSDEEEMERFEKQRKLEVLRAERLRREREEQRRTEELLAKVRGDKTHSQTDKSGYGRQKYNSQFNPELAKQNSY